MPKDKARDSDSWFTPPEYLESVRTALGKIDLDPFTSAKANEIVQAKRFFSIENSAFTHEWDVVKNGRVFMNPPYSSGLCSLAINRFIDQYLHHKFSEGIVLVNNATDTRWFNLLVQNCDAICFTHHRISFWNADQKHISGNTRGQAFFYFGPSLERFKNSFAKHGFIVVPLK